MTHPVEPRNPAGRRPRSRQTSGSAEDVHRLDVACRDAADALTTVRRLLPETGGRPHTGVIGRHAPESSEPWQGEAAAAYWQIHFGARQLEDVLRADLGLPPLHPERGGTDGNTTAALTQIADYGPTATAGILRIAVQRVESWVAAARRIADVDETDVWVPVPRIPGALPPTCPYCQAFTLRMSVTRQLVRCINPPCADGDGRRPIARMERGPMTGEGLLVFGDATVVHFTEEAEPYAEDANA